MYVSWKARKSTFLFHSGILERGRVHNNRLIVKQSKCTKSGFEHFDSFTIMDPTSLQDAGMKKKS